MSASGVGRGATPAGAAGGVRVGSRYAILALACLGLAVAGWPWSAVLAWPATALAVVAAGYLGLGPAVFRKSGGRLPLGTLVVLGPYLLGRLASCLYYRRRGHPHGEVVPGVLLGRRLSEVESEAAVRKGVSAVLDLTAECSESRRFRKLAYENVPVLDLTVPTPGELRRGIEFIRRHRAAGTVYVHCALGYSRSACVVAAYLLAEGLAATVEDAVARVRRARSEVVLTPAALACLRAAAAEPPGLPVPAAPGLAPGGIRS